MGKAIGYFRMSDGGGQAGSGGDPEQSIRLWCSSHQHQVSEVHSDQGVASNGLEQALKSAVDAALLVVDTVQSLTAEGTSPEQVYARLQAAGTRLVAIQEQLDESADPAAVRNALGIATASGPDVRITFSAASGDDAQDAPGDYALPEVEGDEVADEYAVPSLTLDEDFTAEEMAELAPAPSFGDEEEAGVVPADENESVGVWSLDDDDDGDDADDASGDDAGVSVTTDQTDIDALLESRQESVSRAAESGAKPSEQSDVDFLMAMHASGPAKAAEPTPEAAPEPAVEAASEAPLADPVMAAPAPSPADAPDLPAPTVPDNAVSPQPAAPEAPTAERVVRSGAGVGDDGLDDLDDGKGTFPPTFGDAGKSTVGTPAQQTDIDFLVAMHGARSATGVDSRSASPSRPKPSAEADEGYTLPPSQATPLGIAPADAPPLGGAPAQEAGGNEGMPDVADGDTFTVPPSAAPPLGGVSGDATSAAPAAPDKDDRVIYPIDDDYGYQVPPRRPQTEASQEATPEAAPPAAPEPPMELGADNPFEDLAREMAGEATMQVAHDLMGGDPDAAAAPAGEEPEDPARGMRVPPPPPGVPLRHVGRMDASAPVGKLREAPKSYSPLAPISGPDDTEPSLPDPAQTPAPPAEAAPPVTHVSQVPQAPAEFSAEVLSADAVADTPATPEAPEPAAMEVGEVPPMADFLEQGGMMESPTAQAETTASDASDENAAEIAPLEFGAPAEPEALDPGPPADPDINPDRLELKPVQGGTSHMVHGELEEQAPKTFTPVGMFGKAVRDDDAEAEPEAEPEPAAALSEDEIPAGLMSDEPAGQAPALSVPADSGSGPGMDVMGAIARARAEVTGEPGLSPGFGVARPADWHGGDGATAVQSPPPSVSERDARGMESSVHTGPAAWDRRARVSSIPASITGAGVVDLTESEEMADLSRLRRHSDYVPVAEAASQEVARGRFTSALEMWQKFLPSAEGHNRGMAMNAVGDVYVRLGKTALAIEHFEKAVQAFEESGYYTKAVAALKKVRKLVPDKTKSHLRLGELAARCGRLGDAVEAYLNYAREMVAKGDVFAAQGIFDRIRILDPVNARHRLQLAAEFRDFGFLDEAVAEVVNAADILMAQGLNEDARRHLAVMADAAPNNPLLQQAQARLDAGEAAPEPEPPVEGGVGGAVGDLDGEDGAVWHRPLESDAAS